MLDKPTVTTSTDQQKYKQQTSILNITQAHKQPNTKQHTT